MLVDHIGAMFFPASGIWRMIGRLAMPIFAYCIAQGLCHTKNRKMYIKRMAIFSVLSQLPFVYFRHYCGVQDDLNIWRMLNIGFVWLSALIIIHLWEDRKMKDWKRHMLMSIILVATAFVPMDYGVYAVLLVIVFYYLMVKSDHPNGALFANFIVLLGYGGLNYAFAQMWGYEQNNSLSYAFATVLSQLPAIFAVPLISWLKEHDSKIKLNKWVFYIFYSAHMLVLVAIKHLWF